MSRSLRSSQWAKSENDPAGLPPSELLSPRWAWKPQPGEQPPGFVGGGHDPPTPLMQKNLLHGMTQPSAV